MGECDWLLLNWTDNFFILVEFIELYFNLPCCFYITVLKDKNMFVKKHNAYQIQESKCDHVL